MEEEKTYNQIISEESQNNNYIGSNDPKKPSYLKSLDVENVDSVISQIDSIEERHPECQVSLIIPAKDEESNIEKLLQSLSEQQDLNGENLNLNLFEIIIVVNNTTDETIKKAQEKIEEINKALEKNGRRDRLRVHILEINFKEGKGGVGKASKIGMDLALQREVPIIARYGADTIFDHKWMAYLINSFKDESVDAVQGSISLNEEYLTEEEKKLFEKWYRYNQLYSEPDKKIKEKSQSGNMSSGEKVISGGVSAVRREAYIKAGGMGIEKVNEDIKFGDKLREKSARIIHNSEMKAYTSPRAESRTGGGLGQVMLNIRKSIENGTSLMVENPLKRNELIDIDEAIRILELRNRIIDSFVDLFEQIKTIREQDQNQDQNREQDQNQDRNNDNWIKEAKSLIRNNPGFNKYILGRGLSQEEEINQRGLSQEEIEQNQIGIILDLIRDSENLEDFITKLKDPSLKLIEKIKDSLLTELKLK